MVNALIAGLIVGLKLTASLQSGLVALVVARILLIMLCNFRALQQALVFHKLFTAVVNAAITRG